MYGSTLVNIDWTIKERVIEEAEKLVEEEEVVPTLYDLLVEFGRGNLCAAMEPDN